MFNKDTGGWNSPQGWGASNGSLLRKLKKAGCVLFFDADKANGLSKGINSPFSNPLIDLTKLSSDATLVSYAGTESSGFVDKLLPNGNTRTMIKSDGLSDYATLLNDANLDILGTNDFGFGGIYLTDPILAAATIFSRSASSTATTQYELYHTAAGAIIITLGGTAYTTAEGVLLPNSLYEILCYRIGGVLKIIVNDVTVYNQANVKVLVTQPHTRLFARSSSAGGTVHIRFNNDFINKFLVYHNGLTGLVESEVLSSFKEATKTVMTTMLSEELILDDSLILMG